MSFGGFLGIGEQYHPLPWDVLSYSPEHDGYVVDLDRDRLEGAPSYAAGETGQWDDPAYGRHITDYYARSCRNSRTEESRRAPIAAPIEEEMTLKRFIASAAVATVITAGLGGQAMAQGTPQTVAIMKVDPRVCDRLSHVEDRRLVSRQQANETVDRLTT